MALAWSCVRPQAFNPLLTEDAAWAERPPETGVWISFRPEQVAESAEVGIKQLPTAGFTRQDYS